jgi:type VI secretion system protein ImpM
VSSEAVTGEPGFGRIAGWYGKIPAVGDFATRRVPREFVATWDDWLQRSLASSASALGAAWLDVYLQGPILRFVLLPGICGESLWTGIVMPSVDRVGRYFPLTIVVALEERPGTLAAAVSSHNWFAALEKIALRTLESDALPEELDAGLVEAPFPWSPVDVGAAVALAGWWRTPSTAGHATDLADVNRLDDLVLAGAESAFTAAGRGNSLWWSLGEGRVRLRCFTGLPPPEYFSDLLRNTGR